MKSSKKHRSIKRKRRTISTQKRKLVFKSSKRLPKRYEVLNSTPKKYKGGGLLGGVAFPATFSQSYVDANPQSYLPVNTFSNDPNYSVVDARLTSPFLTGVSSGGMGRGLPKKRRKKRALKIVGGAESHGFSDLLSNTFGQLPGGGIPTNLTGVAGVTGNMTGSNNAFNSDPHLITPLS